VKNNTKQTTLAQDIEIAYSNFFILWKVILTVILTLVMAVIRFNIYNILNIEEMPILNAFYASSPSIFETAIDVFFMTILGLVIYVLSNPIKGNAISEKLYDVRDKKLYRQYTYIYQKR
jgi:hypothetical protein